MKSVLVAVEMEGTLNGLKGALKRLERQEVGVYYAAAGAAEKSLAASGTPHFADVKDFGRVLEATKPQLVVVGAVGGVSAPSGIEVGFGLAAMDRGIPVVLYRDFTGFNYAIARPLSEHPRANELLRFHLFDEASAKIAKRRHYIAAETIAVGSGYYDEDATRDWAAERAKAREALKLTEDDFLITMISGSLKERVLEILEPTIMGLKNLDAIPGHRSLVFAPLFHPNDPDAPYAVNPEQKGHWLPKKGEAYNDVLSRLNGTGIRVMREPEMRNALTDPKARIAASDFILMNPLSTETWTAVYARIPFLITALPGTIDQAEEVGIEVTDFDFVAKRACDIVFSADALEHYLWQRMWPENRERIMVAQKAFTARGASEEIAKCFLKLMETASVPVES